MHRINDPAKSSLGVGDGTKRSDTRKKRRMRPALMLRTRVVSPSNRMNTKPENAEPSRVPTSTPPLGFACCWATAAANHMQMNAPSLLQMTCAERGSTHGLASYRLSRVMACTTPRSFGATLARGVLTCGIVVGSALLVSFAGNHWHVGAWLAPYLPSSDTVLLVIVTPIAFVAVVLEALAPILLPLLVGVAVWSLVNAVRSQRGGRSAALLHS